MNEKEIQKWRERVGHDEASRIAAKAASRGTRIHELCENYINNLDIVYDDYSYQDRLNFNDLKVVLDNNIDNVHLQETRLYSDYLQMAGTVDCVAEWKGKLAIIDFKTAKKEKKREYIKNYFCQASAYAIMYEERFGIPVSRTVIIISVDDEPVQVFEERRDNYVKDLLAVRQQYRDKFNM